MRVAAAALVALGAAAGFAGWYVCGAIVLALAFTHAANRLVLPVSPTPRRQQWLAGGVTLASQTVCAALFASVFAAYLFPAHTALAAPLCVLVVGVAAIAGLRVNTYYRRWFAGVALLAAAVFLAICLTIPPAQRIGADAVPSGGGALLAISVQRVGADAGPPVGGVLLAIAVCVPLFAGTRSVRAGGGLRGYLSIATVAVVPVAVAAAAMYQIGPVRFGLYPTSLHTVIVAAEASSLLALLAVTVALTTVPACLDALRQVRTCFEEGEGSWRTSARDMLPGLVAAAALATVLEPVRALLVAAVVVLLRALLRAVLVLRQRRNIPAIVVAVVAVVLLVSVPLPELVTGVILAAVGAAGARFNLLRARRV